MEHVLLLKVSTRNTVISTKMMLKIVISSWIQECMDRQGSASGSCAAGFGVCCVFLASTCGSTVKENCTYVR